MPDPHHQHIEVYGEGTTDLGMPLDSAGPPDSGVLPILVFKLCDSPTNMRVKRKKYASLQQKGGFDRKVEFAKRQAFYNPGTIGLVFVVDTEGDHPRQITLLTQGRDRITLDLPTAVGVAHPCIEAWLLSDAKAIQKAMGLCVHSALPEKPEELPAPRKDANDNPKRRLAKCVEREHMSAQDTTAIANAIHSFDNLCRRCPASFAPFAEEVARSIKPLF